MLQWPSLPLGIQRTHGFRDVVTESRCDQKLHIPQKSVTPFVLDGRDEEPDEEGCSWKHMMDMNDSSRDAVAIAFAIRCPGSWECVHPNGTLAFPKMSPTDAAKLDRAEKQGVQSTQAHCDKRWNLGI